MWKLLKKIFWPDAVAESHAETSIQKLVNFNALNKRKNIRIRFPHVSACGPFPKVFYMGHEINTTNISVGGLLVVDDSEKFKTELGDVVLLDFAWDDFSTQLRARLVGANGDRRHLQFVDFQAQVFIRVSKMIKPGYLGSRFHRVQDDGGQLQAEELWVGPTQESLAFPKNGNITAELIMGQERLQFTREPAPMIRKGGEPLALSALHDVFVLLANFPHPTPRVLGLIELVETRISLAKARRSA